MNPPTARASMVDTQWLGGVDSYSHPSFLPAGQYAWAVNATNRGGLISTRPGRARRHSFQGRRAQGIGTLLTLDNDLFAVVAIDGLLYSAPYPFTVFTKISGVSFSPDALKVYFCTAISAAKYNADSTIAVLPTPVRWLIAQDGLNSPVWWDGVTAHQPNWTTKTLSVPVGTSMVESNGRLWVAQGQKVLASDYVMPLEFRERTYVAESDGFHFPNSVTVLAQAPQDSGLFVGTERSLHTLQSAIVDRTKWQKTDKFQADVTLEVGPVSAFGFAYQHGLPWFYTHRGLINMDRAQQGFRTDRLVAADAEMTRSKAAMLPDLTGVALGSFENILLCAVPSSNIFNRHTWIMDGAVAYRPRETSYPDDPVWSGVWTGTFPIQFVNVSVFGVERLYELSYSRGTILDASGAVCGIHLWEDFQPDSDDDGTPIRSSFETRAYVPANEELLRVGYVEAHVTEGWGPSTLSISLAGMSGLYHPLGTAALSPPIGPLAQDGVSFYTYRVTGTPDSVFQSYKRQNRFVRTPENVLVGSNGQNPETNWLEGIDRGFQVKLDWTGRLSIRNVKTVFDKVTEPAYGQQMQKETSPSLVVFDS